MDYEERLICFVDLLGFKSAIEQTIKDSAIRERMFIVMAEFKDKGLERALYAGIPVLNEKGFTTAHEIYGDDICSEFGEHVGLVVTQFSDSFVLSVPANQPGSCSMLLKAVYAIHLQFFFSLGMMMRGGIDVGKLIHVENGPLYGPAMNAAYKLESSSAIYPRVVVSKQAKEHLDNSMVSKGYAHVIKQGFDGQFEFDVIDVMVRGLKLDYSKAEIESQLDVIEQDILDNSLIAHPKIAYLKHQWSLVSDQYLPHRS